MSENRGSAASTAGVWRGVVRSLVLLGVFQLVVLLYVLWQLWWLSAAWGLVRFEGEPLEAMATTIEVRLQRVHVALVVLGVSVVCGVGTALLLARRADVKC